MFAIVGNLCCRPNNASKHICSEPHQISQNATAEAQGFDFDFDDLLMQLRPPCSIKVREHRNILIYNKYIAKTTLLPLMLASEINQQTMLFQIHSWT